jgi:hypothetical protein
MGLATKVLTSFLLLIAAAVAQQEVGPAPEHPLIFLTFVDKWGTSIYSPVIEPTDLIYIKVGGFDAGDVDLITVVSAMNGTCRSIITHLGDISRDKILKFNGPWPTGYVFFYARSGGFASDPMYAKVSGEALR